MSKLTNKDNLKKLAQALDNRSKALVKSSVAEESARAQGIEADLQEQIEETQDMFGGKSIRYITQAEYNQLTDEQKNDPTVVYFITDAEDLSHTHANKELLDKFGSRTLTVGNKGKTFDGSANVSWTLAEIGAAPSSHTHDDRYFTESEINTKVTNLQAEIDADVKVEADRAKAAEAALQAAIDGKAGSVHNHDDRYFTESEINKIVADLQDEIDTDVEAEKERAESAEIYIQTLLEEKAPKVHSHDDRYFTETEVTNRLNGLKEDLQAEIDADVLAETNRAKGIENALQSAVDGKAPKVHAHDDLYYTEDEIDSLAEEIRAEIDADVLTETNRAVAAENALQSAVDGKAPKSHGNHVPQTQTASNKVFLRNDNTWATITPANIGAAASSHAHDDKYYTETEIDAKITTLNNAVNDKAPAVHNHDNLYYTESEVDTIVADLQDEIDADVKAEADRAKGIENSLQAAINGKAPISHSHGDLYYTEDEIDDMVADLQAEIDADVLVETNRAKGVENSLDAAIKTKADSGHTHDGRYYTESEINTKVADLQAEIDADVKVETDRAKAVENALQANIDKKSDSGHTHTNFAIKLNGGTTEGTNLFTYNGGTTKTVNITPSGIGASATGHTHDDRYFTETEIDAKITTINNSIATAKSDAQKYADNKIAALVGSAPESLNTLQELSKAITDHEDIYEAYVVEMDSKLAGKSDTGHTHNYAGSSSAGGAATSANKVNQNLVVKLNGGATEGTNLFTFNGSAAKTINITPSGIGAANSSHGTHLVLSTVTPKVAGTAAIGSDTGAARGDHVHPAQTSVSGNAGSATKLQTARNITIGNKTNSFNGTADITYTLAQIGASPLQKSIVSKTVSNGTLTLSTDRYQYATLANGNTIVLPSVSNFTEINLFVKDCNISTIKLPDNCKWRVDPNLNSGTSFMFKFIYTTQEWLAEVNIYS